MNSSLSILIGLLHDDVIRPFATMGLETYPPLNLILVNTRNGKSGKK